MRLSLITSSTWQSGTSGLQFTRLRFPLRHIIADLNRAKLIIVLIHFMVILYSCTLLLLMRSARRLKKMLAPGLMPPLEVNTRGENEALSISLILSSYCLLSPAHVFDTWLQGIGNSLRERRELNTLNVLCSLKPSSPHATCTHI